jgi:hypothetical protein
MRGAVAAGGGAIAAGTIEVGVAAAAPPGASAPGLAEARALNHALQIEQLLVIAYRQALDSGVTHPPVKDELRRLLGQELQHVTRLERALAQRGEIVPTPPSLAAAQAELTSHEVHWSLTHLRSQHDCLKLLVDVESLAENAYFRAIGELQDPSLLRLCAEIMGCEAQHWTVLSGFLNHQDPDKAAPYPFVEGTP